MFKQMLKTATNVNLFFYSTTLLTIKIKKIFLFRFFSAIEQLKKRKYKAPKRVKY